MKAIAAVCSRETDYDTSSCFRKLPISFGSLFRERGFQLPLKDAETRYHSNELDCTAVHWALTETFRLYILGRKFQLITDNYTTAYVVAKSAMNRKFARYLVILQLRTDLESNTSSLTTYHVSQHHLPLRGSPSLGEYGCHNPEVP
ncbi:RT_RNaseH_2 domain-containing protein [Trichonephila clavipes]|nr:RT_RNaseH_2 domain-containing protein [Trichonephila clavipes]